MRHPDDWYHETASDFTENLRWSDPRDRVFHCDNDGGLVYWNGTEFICANCERHS